MNKKRKTADKILDVVIETCFKAQKKSKREKRGEKIRQDIKIAYEELEKKEELSADELEMVKECYQILGNDSVQSLATVISVLTVFVSIVTVFISIDNIGQSSIGEYIILAGFLFYLVFCHFKICNISKENAFLRNYIVASSILLQEKKQVGNGDEN